MDRKKESITQASIIRAFWRALDKDRKICGPKELGGAGASYLYPIFVRIGVVKK